MEPTLFDVLEPRRLHRRGDPETSRRAAADLAESGALSKMLALTLAILKRHPGMTSNELEATATEEERRNLGDGKLRKRLNDLYHRGMARKGEARVSRVSGKVNETWWPV